VALLLLLLLSTPTPSVSFASWLKCFVDLDPSEVIMFQKVVPASEAKHQVIIEVQPYGRGDEWLSATSTTTTTEDNIVQLPRAFPQTPLTLRVRLRIPPALQGQDIQFVIEAKTKVTAPGDGAGGEDVVGDSVEFIDRGVMCDGKRAFSRRHDEHVILQIDTNLNPNLEYVTLTAGWASEMEAVTLTPVLTLKPAGLVVGGAASEEL
jgi:hypothetical protein